MSDDKKRRKSRKIFDATAGFNNPTTVALVLGDEEVIEPVVMDPNIVRRRPPKFDDVEMLRERIEEYFAYCDPHIELVDMPMFIQTQKVWVIDRQFVRTPQKPYTISGLAVFLDTCRDVLLDYEKAADKEPEKLPPHLQHKDPKILRQFSDTIKKAKMRVHAYVEQRLLGGGHPAGPIFNLKNNFTRWEDKTVVDNPAEAEYHKQVAELRDILVGRYQKQKRKPA